MSPPYPIRAGTRNRRLAGHDRARHRSSAMVVLTPPGCHPACGSAGRLRSLGEDGVIDNDKVRFETVIDKVDVVLDLLGGEFEQRALSVLSAQGGVIVLFVPNLAVRPQSLYL